MVSLVVRKNTLGFKRLNYVSCIANEEEKSLIEREPGVRP
jgi:hypothetical protein